MCVVFTMINPQPVLSSSMYGKYCNNCNELNIKRTECKYQLGSGVAEHSIAQTWYALEVVG